VRRANDEESIVHVRRLGLVCALAVTIALYPSAGSAQASCRFVFGFADLAARLGPETVGTCLENQRTITGPETFAISDRLTLELPSGAAAQRTTTGVLAWFPQTNRTQFYNGDGQWELTAAGISFSAWEIPTAEAQPTASPAPSSAQNQRNAASACFNIYSTARIGALHSSPAEQERVKMEAQAGNYLCGQAADRDGMKGVECFKQAWDAAKGMERVFPGSGQKVYEEKYAACMRP
jgi:hypothetical protein